MMFITITRLTIIIFYFLFVLQLSFTIFFTTNLTDGFPRELWGSVEMEMEE
jgi:hypothetical protein